jgi:hypothetical protein
LSIGFSNLSGQHQAEVGEIQSRLQALGGSELGEIGCIFPPELLAKRRMLLVSALIPHHCLLRYAIKRVSQREGTDPFRPIVPNWLAHLTSGFSIDHVPIFRVRVRKVNGSRRGKAKGAHTTPQ